MNDENLKLNEKLLEIAKKSLIKNGFEVIEAKNKIEAIEMLKNIIAKDATIGTGGSRTLEEIGFHKIFTTKDYPNFLDRNVPDISSDAKKMIQKSA